MSLPSPAQVTELIQSRRSIYTQQFESGRVAPDEVVWQLLENASYAPTHKRTEPWHFVVFTGAGLQKLADFQADLYQRTAGPKFNEGKWEKLRESPLRCSHVIAIGLKRHEGLPEVEEVEAVACAVQNLALSAHAYGLGGYWGSGGVTYSEEAKAFFGLGPHDKLLGFFNLGYPRTEAPAGRRTPVQEKTEWVRG